MSLLELAHITPNLEESDKDTFTLEPDTLAAVQRLTDDPAEFVRQAVTERLTRMKAGDFSEGELAELASLDWDALLDAQEKSAGSS